MGEVVAFDARLIGERLRAARVEKKLTQADVAAITNLSLPTLSDIELGKNKMSLATFFKIIDALQISADAILRGNNAEVVAIYQGEVAEILKDCTPAEIESIKKVMIEVKSAIRNNQNM